MTSAETLRTFFDGFDPNRAQAFAAPTIVAASRHLPPHFDDGDVGPPPHHCMCLYVGVLLLAWFLVAASSDASAFAVFTGFIQSIIGRLVLFGFTWALFNHMLGGIRHFLWDAGYGLDDPQREQLAQATLIGGFALALIAWAIGYAVR